MSRSCKKAPFVEEKLYNRIVAMNETNDKKVLKTWSRASTIFPEFVGHTIAVHDGMLHSVTGQRPTSRRERAQCLLPSCLAC